MKPGSGMGQGPKRPAYSPPPCPCVPGRIATPFGGPASGLWPSGAAPGAQAGQGCLPATLFGECFSGCSGTISAGSPGPICGWEFNPIFGAGAATIDLAPGSMTFNTTSATDFPGATKALPQPLVGVTDVSGQFEFTEYATPPNVDTTYDLFFTNFDLSLAIAVTFFGDSSCFIQVGPVAAAATYIGSWVPGGGAHKVNFTIDPLGNVSLYLDGVLIPLVFTGNVFSFASFLPANTVSFLGGSGDAAPAASQIRNIFLTEGVVGPETVFCCP